MLGGVEYLGVDDAGMRIRVGDHDGQAHGLDVDVLADIALLLAVFLPAPAGREDRTCGEREGGGEEGSAKHGRILHRELRFGAIGRTTVRQRSVVEALRMLMELARGPQASVKPRREAVSRLRPRVAPSGCARRACAPDCC